MKYSDLFSFSPYSDDDSNKDTAFNFPIFPCDPDFSQNATVPNFSDNEDTPEKLRQDPTPTPTATPTPPPIPTPPPFDQGPPPLTSSDYIPGYLATIIGKNIRAEFVVSASAYVEKTGRLIDVGVNYFILEDANSQTQIMCDLYSVKFVTVLPI